MKSCGIITDLH